MSQVIAARTASRPVVSSQWWHVSLSAGDFDAADGIIEELITPLVAQAQKYGAKRWYFTRSRSTASGGGSDVVLSVQAHPRVLARLRSFQQEHRTGPGSASFLLSARQYFTPPASDTYYAGGQHMADPQLEANLVRYGGVEGLGLAEEVFELGSELAIWAAQRFPRPQSRSAFAAILLFDAAQSMTSGPHSERWIDRRISWGHYWDSHLRTCTADAGVHAADVRTAMTAHVSTKAAGFHSLMDAEASELAVQRWRRRWSQALDSYLHRANRVCVSRSALHLTVYQAHMMLNRLGISAAEEAPLGLYARSWVPRVTLSRGPAGTRRRSSDTAGPGADR